MAGVVPSSSISTLPSQDPDPNPDPNPNPNNGAGVGGGTGGSGSTANSSPTPTPSMNILPPASSPTSTFDALPSPTVIIFNDAANFGTQPAGRVYFTSNRTKTFSWRIGNSTTTPLDISWYGMPKASGEPFDISQAKVITRAKFGDSKPGNEIISLSSSSAILNLTGSDLVSGDWYQKDMVIKIDWKTQNGNLGFTQSGVFTVANSTSSIDINTFNQDEATDNEQDRRGGEAVTSSVNNPTLPTSGPSNPSDGNGNGIGGSSSGDSSGGGGHGLSTGAIAGIAVACSVVGILLIGGLAWFLLRRRRRRHFDQGYNAAGQTTNSFVATKEVQASVAESPIISPFSDDGTRTGSTNAMLPLQTTIAGTSAARGLSTHDDEADRPGSSASDNNNRSRNIAHLVEEGMTEADILRLEEEERHLDAEIERAARRTST